MNTPGASKYPTLKEMGVESPQQVRKYHITSINAVDILRLVYERPDGSFLPSYRSYKFPRVQDNEGKKAKLRTHPKLLDAIKELDTLLESISTKENIKEEILSEIALLEEDIAVRGERIKELAKRILEVD